MGLRKQIAWLGVLVVLGLQGCSVMSRSDGRAAPIESRGNAGRGNANMPAQGVPSQYSCNYSPANAGGFYKDDGPLSLPANLDQILEPVPQAEPLHRYANRPYTVLGQNFVPLTKVGDYQGRGIGSWYGRRFQGQKTSSGEVYDMFQMTAAHPTLPIPSYARVTNLKNGRNVVVRINDRGPFLKGREIDLSFLAACRLGYAMQGSTEVAVVSLAPGGGYSAAPVTVAAVPVAAEPAVTSATAENGRVEVMPLPLAEPVPATPTPERATPAAAGDFYLQLAAFSSRGNAEEFLGHFSRELDADANRLVIQQSGPLFRVRLGPFPNRQAAQDYADRLTGRGNIKAIIVR